MAVAEIEALRGAASRSSRSGETEGDACEEEGRKSRSWASILDALDGAEDDDMKAITARCFDIQQVKRDRGEGVLQLLRKSAA